MIQEVMSVPAGRLNQEMFWVRGHAARDHQLLCENLYAVENVGKQ